MKKSPFHKLKIEYLSKKKLNKFTDAAQIARLHSINSTEPFAVQETRRLLRIMWEAAELVKERPANQEISLFEYTSEEITKTSGKRFKKYVESQPHLHAYIDHFRLKLKSEKDKSGVANYLNSQVEVSSNNQDYKLKKGQILTPKIFSQMIIKSGEEKNNPMLQYLGSYFEHKIKSREKRIEKAIRYYQRLDNYNQGPV
jgi:hypothetical protein